MIFKTSKFEILKLLPNIQAPVQFINQNLIKNIASGLYN